MLLVTAKSDQKLLKKLAEITTSLDSLVDSQGILGYRSINQQLLSKTNVDTITINWLNNFIASKAISYRTLGWSSFPELPKFETITVSGFLESPVSEPVRPLLVKADRWTSGVGHFDQRRHRFRTVLSMARFKFCQQQGVKYLNKADEISASFAGIQNVRSLSYYW